MRVIPPEVPQPPTVIQSAPNNDSLLAKDIQEAKNNGEITATPAPSIIGQSIQQNTDTKEIFIRKKAQYRAFMRLIKDNKYTSAILSSRVLGVDKNTITLWLQTKQVRELLQATYSTYINKIAESKQWQAQAYLLDKLEDKDNEKDHIDIQNIILIKR